MVEKEGIRRRVEFWEVEIEWRGGVEREREAFGRVVWKWVISVLWESIERRVLVEMNTGAVVVVGEGVAIVWRKLEGERDYWKLRKVC